MAEGFWNGLPTKVRRVVGTVAPWDPEQDPPQAWWRDIQGERIVAVEVVLDGVNYGGGISYLDDRDGSGWRKVTEGHGSPRWAHRNVRLIDVVDFQDDAGEPERDEPLLGLATTRELLTELAVRMEITQNSIKGRELGVLCRHALANLAPNVLEYRTAATGAARPPTPR